MPKVLKITSLQYFSNISRKKWAIDLFFCMKINIVVFYKLIPSFMVVIARHAQSTQKVFSKSQPKLFALEIRTSLRTEKEHSLYSQALHIKHICLATTEHNEYSKRRPLWVKVTSVTILERKVRKLRKKKRKIFQTNKQIEAISKHCPVQLLTIEHFQT